MLFTCGECIEMAKESVCTHPSAIDGIIQPSEFSVHPRDHFLNLALVRHIDLERQDSIFFIRSQSLTLLRRSLRGDGINIHERDTRRPLACKRMSTGESDAAACQNTIW